MEIELYIILAGETNGQIDKWRLMDRQIKRDKQIYTEKQRDGEIDGKTEGTMK